MSEKHPLPGGRARGVYTQDNTDLLILFRNDDAVAIPVNEAVDFATDLLTAYRHKLEDLREARHERNQ